MLRPPYIAETDSRDLAYVAQVCYRQRLKT